MLMDIDIDMAMDMDMCDAQIYLMRLISLLLILCSVYTIIFLFIQYFGNVLK